MIVKFFKSNKQPIQKAFAYLLNVRVENNTAKLLWGNRELAEILADNQTSSIKYFSGCLSFKEAPSYFNEHEKYEIIDEFMKAIMPHEEIRERINWTWIEHTDKGRLELNFVVNTRFLEPIGNIKQYNFFCKNHFQTIDTFQDFIDVKYNCISWKSAQPNIYKHHLNARKDKTFNHEMLQYMIENIIIENPTLETREDLITYLKEVGFNVSRAVRGSISILPEYSSKPIRLSIPQDVSLLEYRQKIIFSLQNQLDDFPKQNQIQDLKEKLELCKQRTYTFEQKRYFKKLKVSSMPQKTVSIRQKIGKEHRSCLKHINHQNQSEKFSNSLKNQEKHIKTCFSTSHNPLMNHGQPIDELSEEEYAKYIIRIQKWLIEEASKSFGEIAYFYLWKQSIEDLEHQFVSNEYIEQTNNIFIVDKKKSIFERKMFS